MGISSLIERFKKKKKKLAERSKERVELRRDERDADRASKRTAISEARQLKRDSRAKYIKEKYGSYTPLSQRIGDAAKSSAKALQEHRAKVLQSHQPQTATKKKKKSIPIGNNFLSGGQGTPGPTGNVNFNFGGPNLGGGSLSKDIVTGKTIKRR